MNFENNIEKGELFLLDSDSDLPQSLKEKFDLKSSEDFDLFMDKNPQKF